MLDAQKSSAEYFSRSAGIEFFRRKAVGGKDSRPALVLLHGIGSNATSWKSTIDSLPQDVDTIAWHAPGYDLSEMLSSSDPSPSDYADALDRLLNTLNVGRVVLVGHSLGSLFAGRYAATRHARVAGLGLFCANGKGVTPFASTAAGRIDCAWREGVCGAKGGSPFVS